MESSIHQKQAYEYASIAKEINGTDKNVLGSFIKAAGIFYMTIGTWRRRSFERRQLLRMNYNELKDIGLTRIDAMNECGIKF